MTNANRKGKSTGKSGDILDLVPSLKLHPWESAEDFQALEQRLIAEFAPGTALELSIVKRLAANEWEQHRSDTLRADITCACLRKGALAAMMGDNLRTLPNPEERDLADALVGDDTSLRRSARDALDAAGISVADLSAQAYLQFFREFDALERRGDVFDRRRRDLLEDLRVLQKRRQDAAIEDAELVATHGD